MAVLAIDTIGHLPVMSKGNRWALTAICLHALYVFAVSMKERSAENLFKPIYQAYQLTKVEVQQSSVTMEQNLKTKLLMKHVINMELRDYAPTHSTPRVIQEQRMFIISLNKHSPNSQNPMIWNGMTFYHLHVIVTIYFPAAMAQNLHYSCCLDAIQQWDD